MLLIFYLMLDLGFQIKNLFKLSKRNTIAEFLH